MQASSRVAGRSRTVSVVCSANKQAVTAAALAAVVGLANVQPAAADVAGLTPCSESKAFQKVQTKELKGLEKRLKGVSGLAQALQH